MKNFNIKGYNWFPKRDEEGDMFWNFNLIPAVQFTYSPSSYALSWELEFSWLFWELNIQYIKEL